MPPHPISIEKIMKRTMEESNTPSELLQLMGITEEYQDPGRVHADWHKVSTRLLTHPHEASIMRPGGISFPLNLALCNSVTPAPAWIINEFIRYYPEAATEEDFGNACRYPHTTGSVLLTLLRRNPAHGKDVIKRWDLDWIACNNNKDAAIALISNCKAANPSTIKEWREMRPSSHTFWFTLLMQKKSYVVTQNNIQDKRLLQFFILQGNYDNVKLILDTYPQLLLAPSRRGNKTNQLPIHTALSSINATEYRPWHNRSPIVKLLLQRGFEANVGGDNGGGGLYAKDSHAEALTYAIDAGLNSRWEDPERKKCLQICLQFAQADMYGRSADQVDLNMPMLHAAIGVVSVDILSTILRSYGITILDKDDKGRTALFQLISLMADRPANGYATTNSVMANKRRDREREMADRNFVLTRVRFDRDVFEQLLQHQGRQGLEVMAARLWDREQEVLEVADLDRLRTHREMEETNDRRRLPGAVQRLVNALDERERDAGDFLDIAINRAAGVIRRRHVDNEANEEPGQVRHAFLPQPQQDENRLQPAGQQDQVGDALPRRIPFIFQPIRPILESANGNNAAEENNAELAPNLNLDNAEPEVAENVDNQPRARAEANLEDHNANINGNIDRARALFARRARIRRPNRRRQIANNNFEEDAEMAVDPNDDIILRNMFEARDRELDELQERLIEKKYFGCIRKILLKDVQVPHDRLRTTKKLITTNCARVKDAQNRLPLHYAAEKGYFSEGFQEILAANPEAVCEIDGASLLFPFAIACANTQRLDITFDLLLRNPSVMDYILR